jgi:glyoxylase-like metal-dependent hydrolase (beta-lactamase superfamily II)
MYRRCRLSCFRRIELYLGAAHLRRRRPDLTIVNTNSGQGPGAIFSGRPNAANSDTASPAISLGRALIRRVEEVRYKYPLSMFGLDEGTIDRNWHWLFPRFADSERNWDMVVQSWITVIDDKVVVVDPCVGNGRSFADLPMFDMLQTPFIERFTASGFRPEDVDVVFCTHLHSDHCGWNTQLCDGHYVPTFPKARYVMVRREFDRWDVRNAAYDHGEVHNRFNAGVFENSVLPVLEAGLADLVSDTHRISASLEIEPAYGHTRGHSCLHLRSAGEEAYFTGDVFHHPLELLYPEIDANTCESHATTVETRRLLVRKLVTRKALIIPAHFAAPYVGYVRESDAGVRFEPRLS